MAKGNIGQSQEEGEMSKNVSVSSCVGTKMKGSKKTLTGESN